MITIIFESHSTSYDNEARLASGWHDVDLSPMGINNSLELGKRYADQLPDVIFCSDLQRSYKTAVRAFCNTNVPIIIDSRLRECDYGALTQASRIVIESQRIQRIDEPFPGGESFREISDRMKSFINDLVILYKDKKVLIIGHRATQYGLEEHIVKKDLKKILEDSWTWQPGWIYLI